MLEFPSWLSGNEPDRIYEDAGLTPGLDHWVKDPVFDKSYGTGHRHGLDPAPLWLWCRRAAVALIQPLAWELPYAVGVALKNKNKKQKKKLILSPINGPGAVRDRNITNSIYTLKILTP